MKTLAILFAVLTLATGCAAEVSDSSSDGAGGSAPTNLQGDSAHILCEGTGPNGAWCMVQEKTAASVDVCKESQAKIEDACSFDVVGCCTEDGATICWPTDAKDHEAKCVAGGGTWQSR